MLQASLVGKTALVTGGGSGIGAKIVEVLVDAGAYVAINDVTKDALAETLASVGPKGLAVPGDVSRTSDVDDIVAQVESWRGIDILVNNAGIAGEVAPVVRQDIDAWQRVIDVNQRGTYLMCRAVAPHMISRRAGAIVNIASIVGVRGFPASHAYGVSKAAVIMLTQTFATELARYSVRVNAVAPGVIDAPMLDHMTDGTGVRSKITARVPLGRLGAEKDVANAVIFLASENAAYVTGATLPVDGGWLAFGGWGEAHVAPKHPT